MTTRLLFLIYAVLTPVLLNAQVGIGTTEPQAALDVRSESSGILIPRMTAAQIEQIAGPDEGELVFSTTNTGTVVNRIGFWYYTGSGWIPIIARSNTGDNLYNTDGDLASDRTVMMGGRDVNIGPTTLFIKGDDGFVGVNTDQPTERLDVDGQLRIRELAEGNLVTTASGMLVIDEGAMHRYGDVRFSYLSTDHDGWYLLNGRALTALPADAQARAASLGITSNLPNATGLYAKQGAPGTITGATNVTLSTANMPNFILSGTTSFSSHSHSLISPGFSVIRGTNATNVTTSPGAWSWQLAGGAAPGSVSRNRTYTSSQSGAHSHTVTVSTGGSNTPIPLNPTFLQLNYFIYLGK
ncbi:hypothetical protein ACFOET_19510 [Parapedobacter deserti]|uniref:Microcystin-dependent protein n=1 Tax=Parapedobacter deserti TaxID=1912957 RepID=A0ABV7JNZ2_9SPHI